MSDAWFSIWTQTGRGFGRWSRFMCRLCDHNVVPSAYGGQWCRRCHARWELTPITCTPIST